MTEELHAKLEALPMETLLGFVPSPDRPLLWADVVAGQQMGIIPLGRSRPNDEYLPLIAEAAQKRIDAARAMPPMTLDQWADFFVSKESSSAKGLFAAYCVQWLNVDLPTTTMSYDAWTTHWEEFTDVPF